MSNPLPQERCAYPLGIAHDASFHECELPKGHDGHHALLAPEARVEQDPTSDEALVAQLNSHTIKGLCGPNAGTGHPFMGIIDEMQLAATRIEALNREWLDAAVEAKRAQEVIERVRANCVEHAQANSQWGRWYARRILSILDSTPVTADEPKTGPK